MRLLSQGGAITASIIVNNAALAEKPEHSSTLCRVICESQDTYQIRVSVPDDCPEPIMVSVYLDGTMLKYRYPFWPGTTRLIEGFQQDDGSLFAFQFAAPPIQLLSEEDAQSASAVSSDSRQAAVGTIKLVFNRASRQEQLSFPSARARASQSDDAPSSKRSKSQHGDSKTDFSQSPSPPSLGTFHFPQQKYRKQTMFLFVSLQDSLKSMSSLARRTRNSGKCHWERKLALDWVQNLVQNLDSKIANRRLLHPVALLLETLIRIPIARGWKQSGSFRKWWAN
jgi:hypothetical protein